jgi:ATP-binding cassette, subfamily B, bacterial
MLFQSKFPYHFQYDRMDCGPACLRMVCNYFGRDVDVDYLRSLTFISRQGVSLLDLSGAAEQLGFRTMMIQLTVDELLEDCPFPAILHWNQDHYVVLYGIKQQKNWFLGKKEDPVRFHIADPAHGVVTLNRAHFKSNWERDGSGIALVLLPTDAFFSPVNGVPAVAKRGRGLYYLLKYLKPYRKYFIHLSIGILLGSFISLLFPFLMRNLIDKGVAGKNLNVVLLILLSQLSLFLGEVVIDFLRNWILLHVNTRVSLSVISDFLNRLMRLPIRFFDATTSGDIKQRINDHYRVENFLTSTALITLFSVLTILVFSIVLATYSLKIFLLFTGLSLLGTGWIVIFLRRRKNLEYKRFQSLKDNQDSILEIITGMQEIKLNNCELTKRWEWERIQAKLFKVNTQSLVLDQYQRIGFNFINQLKNIVISYIAAVETIRGSMSVGMMLAISYIVGHE